jgi:hypothetical protein
LNEGAYGVIDVALPPSLAPTAFDRYGAAPLVVMLLISLATLLRIRNAILRGKGNA